MGSNDVRIRKSKFVAKTQFHSFNLAKNVGPILI